MDADDRRAELLERAYQRGYELRLRRRRWLALTAGVVAIAVIGGVALVVSRSDNEQVSVRKTTSPPGVTACTASIEVVPPARVPHDVAAWAGGAPVVGSGALWTTRSAIDVAPTRQLGAWSLKFPWYTAPFGLPSISARRLDGPGTFHAEVHPATDNRGTWVVSGLDFSHVGCWQVTGRYRTSTVRFRVHVVDVPATPATSATPSEIVALEAYGSEIAVISASSGKVIRVLAASQGLAAGSVTLAVTPDGQTVYFATSRRPAKGECTRGLVDEIARVSIRGGPVSVVGPGVWPAVSPNGKFLAYTRDAASPCGTNQDQLVVLDLESGTRRTFISAHLVSLESLAWAADSVQLAYNEYTAQSPTSPKLLDTATAHSLGDAAPIPHARDADWGGFLGSTGADIGVTPHNGSRANPATVVELDPASGVIIRTLFEVPVGLAVGNVGDGPEDTLHADRSGKDVLAIGLLPVHAPVFRHGALYRWHEGDARPTLVADNIWDAVWLEPNASRSP